MGSFDWEGFIAFMLIGMICLFGIASIVGILILIVRSMTPPDIQDMKAKRDVKGLINALGNKKVREDSAKALGELKDPLAVEPLIAVAVLKDHDYSLYGLRIIAVKALGNIGDSRAVETLISLLYESGISSVVEDELEKIGGPNVEEALAKYKNWKSSEQLKGESKMNFQPVLTEDIRKALAVLEDAHELPYNEELEKRVNDALDSIAANGEVGIKVLLERLYRDMRMSGSNVDVPSWGDFAWNEWLKQKAIVYALGRAKAKSVVPQLISLLGATSKDQQFYEILQPAAAKALGEIGDKHAIEPLRNCLRNDDVSNKTKRAIGEALEQLEGQPVLDPALIIAKADNMNKKEDGEDVLKLLAQIDSSMFDTLTKDQKYYVWYLRGLVYKWRGDKSKAIDCFQTSLNYYNASDAMAHRHLAELKS